jgi:hypothetical protein
MSTSSTSKILICIFSCEKDKNSLSKLKDTSWYRDVRSCDNFTVIDVFANPLINDRFNLKEGSLTVKTEESYSNLCIKTYKMIEACVESFDFDYLLKIDGNIIENRHNETSMLFSFDYFLEKFYNEGVVGEYNGLTPITNNTIKQFRNWASSKKIFVMPEALISYIGKNKWAEDYWAGNCYCLGRSSIDKILKQKDLFIKFKNLMGGCEDFCVACSLKDS